VDVSLASSRNRLGALKIESVCRARRSCTHEHRTPMFSERHRHRELPVRVDPRRAHPPPRVAARLSQTRLANEIPRRNLNLKARQNFPDAHLFLPPPLLPSFLPLRSFSEKFRRGGDAARGDADLTLTGIEFGNRTDTRLGRIMRCGVRHARPCHPGSGGTCGDERKSACTYPEHVRPCAHIRKRGI